MSELSNHYKYNKFGYTWIKKIDDKYFALMDDNTWVQILNSSYTIITIKTEDYNKVINFLNKENIIYE